MTKAYKYGQKSNSKNSYIIGGTSSSSLEGFSFGTSIVENGNNGTITHQGRNGNAPAMQSVSDTLYQVDFYASASGKHIAPTKRHVRFHFGFANFNANNGQARGVECRGKEHIVELIWSLMMGKGIILLDGGSIMRHFIIIINNNNHSNNRARQIAQPFGNRRKQALVLDLQQMTLNLI
jgi:hypothetical protein